MTTVTAGQKLTAALLDSLFNPPLCVAYASTAQSIPNAAWTSILLNNNRTDTYSGHSTSVNTSRYTAQLAGWYEVAGNVPLNAASAPSARLAVNGAVVLGSQAPGGLSASGTGGAQTTLPVFLNVGDYVELQVFQSSGGAVNTLANGVDWGPALSVTLIHR
jgi:hypothetical protein